MKQHAIPSDKGRYGRFQALSQQNLRLVQQILSEDSSTIYSMATLSSQIEDPNDTLVLEKLRGLYSSCMNEEIINGRGSDPLLRIVHAVRSLYNGKTTIIHGVAQDVKDEYEKKRKGLTAAIAYLQSKGPFSPFTFGA